MKLWDKGITTDQKVEKFTIGNDRELDIFIAKYDLLASIAHVKMLGTINLLTANEVEAVEKELNAILNTIEKHDFKIEPDFEDIHSKIEFILTQKLGDAGKKIHTARSRNDQVLVAIHLFLKEELDTIKTDIETLFQLLIKLAKQYENELMPGYTHLQIAMPSSFGLWFSAYAESLIDDLYFINAAYKVTDQNPLGSAAGYGSSFPIDRVFTTKTLNFSDLKYNVISAQMSRGKVEKAFATGISFVAATLAKMSMDICLYMSQNFNFISFPDSLTTGSSIMPHKKNPDVFELIRGKCNTLQAIPLQLNLLTTNLPSGYHRDLQLTKQILFPAIQELKACLEMITFSLQNIQIRKDILKDPLYDHLFSVETLNELVQKGVPFREAYKQVAQDIEKGNYKPDKKINHTHVGSIGNLCLDKIQLKMKKALS